MDFPTWRLLSIVAVGGAVGSVSRYLLHLLTARHFAQPFPLGTLLVNVLGCLLIGFFYAATERSTSGLPELRLLLIPGFCGGFTTFSAFSYETITLLTTGHYLYAVLYVTGIVGLGLGATLAGIMAGRFFL